MAAAPLAWLLDSGGTNVESTARGVAIEGPEGILDAGCGGLRVDGFEPLLRSEPPSSLPPCSSDEEAAVWTESCEGGEDVVLRNVDDDDELVNCDPPSRFVPHFPQNFAVAFKNTAPQVEQDPNEADIVSPSYSTAPYAI